MAVDPQAYIVSKFPDRAPNAAGKIHAKCPFHDDKHPSFSIDINKGLFVCGSPRCGVRGNFALFYKMMEGIDWKQVYEAFKSHSAIAPDLLSLSVNGLFETPSSSSSEVTNDFPTYPFVVPLGKSTYLDERGISDETRAVFELYKGCDGEFSGVDIHDSIVFPVYDLAGAYRTFQVRKMTSKLRWQSPWHSPIHKFLYGSWILKGGDYLWITEGASDVWNLHSKGVQAVGLFTKESSATQLNGIQRICQALGLVPVCCLDGDATKYNDKLLSELCAYGLKPLKIVLPSDRDGGNLNSDELEYLKGEINAARSSGKEVSLPTG